MNTNIHSLIHKMNADKLPHIHKFYILAYILLNWQSIIRKLLLPHRQRFYLLVLLTFKIQPQVFFKTNIYTHLDKKNHALKTGIRTSFHKIL